MGEMMQSSKEINYVFKSFYSQLYSLDQNLKQSEIDTLVKDLGLSKLSKPQANMFDNPLTLNEHHKAMEKMP